MKVRIKKLHENAVIPSYAKPGDAGLDLTATSKSYDRHHNVVYGTGLAFEIPEGYVGLLFPRSSNFRYNVLLTNSVGVLDSGYRGEVMFKYRCSSGSGADYKIGDKEESPFNSCKRTKQHERSHCICTVIPEHCLNAHKEVEKCNKEHELPRFHCRLVADL